MSTESHSDDDLTTDAIPSPPRDKVLHTENSNEEHAENVNTQPKTKPRAKVYKNSRKKVPTAFASVINISNANGVHVGANYNVYLNKGETPQTPQTPQKTNYIITEAVMALFNSKTVVDRQDLIFLAPHINEDWRNTARILDYSDGQISQFYEDYIKSGIREVIYQLLLDWIQNEADAATIASLSKALWDSSQQDAVTRWSKKSQTQSVIN